MPEASVTRFAMEAVSSGPGVTATTSHVDPSVAGSIGKLDFQSSKTVETISESVNALVTIASSCFKTEIMNIINSIREECKLSLRDDLKECKALNKQIGQMREDLNRLQEQHTMFAASLAQIEMNMRQLSGHTFLDISKVNLGLREVEKRILKLNNIHDLDISGHFTSVAQKNVKKPKQCFPQINLVTRASKIGSEKRQRSTVGNSCSNAPRDYKCPTHIQQFGLQHEPSTGQIQPQLPPGQSPSLHAHDKDRMKDTIPLPKPKVVVTDCQQPIEVAAQVESDHQVATLQEPVSDEMAASDPGLYSATVAQFDLPEDRFERATCDKHKNAECIPALSSAILTAKPTLHDPSISVIMEEQVAKTPSKTLESPDMRSVVVHKFGRKRNRNSSDISTSLTDTDAEDRPPQKYLCALIHENAGRVIFGHSPDSDSATLMDWGSSQLLDSPSTSQTYDPMLGHGKGRNDFGDNTYTTERIYSREQKLVCHKASPPAHLATQASRGLSVQNLLAQFKARR